MQPMAMTDTHQAAAAPTAGKHKVEPAYVLVPLGVFFLCFQLILCRVARFCCWSNHWLFPHVAEVVDYLPNVLGIIAMANIPDEGEASAVVLMLYLIVLNNSLVAYDREKNKMRYLCTAVNIAWFAYHALNTVGRADLGSEWRYVGAYAIVVTMLCAYTYCNIFVGLASASKHYSEAIAEHMMSRTQPVLRQDINAASTLHCCRYVVQLGDVDPEEKETVGTIFSAENDDEDIQQRRRRRDLSLSFALFHLLFCQHHGMEWYQEGSSQESLQVVREGLLGRQLQLQLQQHEAPYDHDSAARGFGVVEAELAFLHDHVHGAYILWYARSGAEAACRALYYVLKGVMAVIIYLVGLGLYLTSDDGPRAWVVIAPLLLYLFFDLLQVVFYLRSDRWMVSSTCHRNQPFWQERYFGSFISFVRGPDDNEMNNNGIKYFYWMHKVGQYSLLPEISHAPALEDNCSIFHQTTGLYSHNAKPSVPAPLPESLKLKIAQVLGGTHDWLVPVPMRVEIAQPDFPEKEGPKANIMVILMWHIATSYCEETLLHEPPTTPSREVAAVLSKYCAYLVAFRPELLFPCSATVVKRTFCDVLDDIRSPQLGHYHRILINPGLDLGHRLITEIQDHTRLWLILESIWLKLILSVAPQESTHGDTYAKTHARYLAQGGEFLTYLWAMLSHAGIQRHSPWPPCIENGSVTPL